MLRRLLAGVVVAAGSLWGPAVAVAWHDWPLGDRVASQLVGRPVTVQCADSYAEWTYGVRVAGVALMDRDSIALAPASCQWSSSAAQRTGGNALTLAHESMHLALDSVDEGFVECHAVQELHLTLFLGNLRGARLARAYREGMALARRVTSGPYAWQGRC